MNEKLMKMNLQMFADDNPEGAEPEGGTDNHDNPQPDEPTVKVAEMKRRLDKQSEDYQKQLDELKTSQEKAIQQAIADYEAKSKMNADELADYKQKEAEAKHQKELEDAQSKIDELTRINQQRQIKDESVTKLNELNIPVNETTLSLVSAGSLDDMSERAGLLAEYTNVLKNEFSTSTTPTGGGGKRTNNTSFGQKLDDARII